MEKTYQITFGRIGFATVRAESAEDAAAIAGRFAEYDILWFNDYEITDIVEDDEVEYVHN